MHKWVSFASDQISTLGFQRILWLITWWISTNVWPRKLQKLYARLPSKIQNLWDMKSHVFCTTKPIWGHELPICIVLEQFLAHGHPQSRWPAAQMLKNPSKGVNPQFLYNNFLKARENRIDFQRFVFVPLSCDSIALKTFVQAIVTPQVSSPRGKLQFKCDFAQFCVAVFVSRESLILL